MTPEAREPGRGINIFIDDDPHPLGARIKVIGKMDIAEKRKPQDGSFSAQVEDRMIERMHVEAARRVLERAGQP